MIIEAAPPAQEPQRKAADPKSYAYATGTTSFITVLSEMKSARDDEKATPPVEQPNEKHTVAQEENTSTVEKVEVSAENGASTETTTAEAETTDIASTTDQNGEATTDDTATDGTATSDPDDGALLLSGAPSSQTEDGEASTEETRVSSTPAVISSPKEVSSGVDDTIHTATTTANVPTQAQPQLKTGDTAPDETLALGAEEETDAPPTPETKPPFPKTLNALLAEKAVNRSNVDLVGKDANPPSAPRDIEVETPTVDAAREPGSDAAPLPQSTATEVGGVRVAPQTSGPRIPMANLPGEIAQQIQILQEDGKSTIRLRLSPENLGELKLEVHRVGDTVRVTMISASPHVRDALDSQMSALRDALEKQGFNLTEALVEDGSNHKGRHDSDTPGMPKKNLGRPITAAVGTTGRPIPTISSNLVTVNPLSSGINVLA